MLPKPLVTVVLPVRNEANNIGRCLEAVFRQDYASDCLEIIVADGMSTDGTRSTVSLLQREYCNLRLIDNPGQIVPTGLNEAIWQAKGEVIVRVDGHTDIAPDYVRQCVVELHRTAADNVGGRMVSIGHGRFGEAVAIATSSPFGVGGARFHYSAQEEWVDTVYMGAWSRRVFEQMGLFDEELVRDQDDEFNYRLREHGGRILLSPKINSQYTVRSTPQALWRQYFQYGFWKVRVLQKHARQMQVRQFVPPMFVVSLLGLGLLSLWSAWALILLIVVAGAYLAANSVASLLTAARKGWHHIAILPVVFAILHVGYGLGFLAGMVKFWNRWGDKRTRCSVPWPLPNPAQTT